MTSPNMKSLQAMIDKCVSASNAFHLAQAKLNDWCRETYGYEPGDIDADEILDSVMGCAGVSHGMSAAEFHRVMRDKK